MNSPRTLIIAEAGVNHNGSLASAFQLIDCAADCGADIVKFQTFRAEKLVSHSAPKAVYQQSNTGDGSQYEMLKNLELSLEQHILLQVRCKEKGIQFLSTPFDQDSFQMLKGMGVNLWKIPSGEITNLPFLQEIAKTGNPIILSTGMSSIEEVNDAVSALLASGAALDALTLLHCTTQYPAPLPDVNLRAMNTLAETFHTRVGYSDHTEGIEVPIAAVALGASVIEKHFTLDKHLPGPDHKASLEPSELKSMIQAIRNVELALGNGIKAKMPSEIANCEVARKSIVAAKPISVGEIFQSDNLTTMRPGNGLSPMKWNKLIGRASRHSYSINQPISKGEL